MKITSIGFDDVYILRDESGKTVNRGDVYNDSKGNVHIVQGGKAPQHLASTGRVHTKCGTFNHELFPSVLNLKWEKL